MCRFGLFIDFWGNRMSREVKSPKYQGVYWRELINGDKQYYLRMRRLGRSQRIPIGKASEGCTEEFCAFKYRAYSESEKFLKEVVDPQNYAVELDWNFEQLLNFYLTNRQLKESTKRQLMIFHSVPFARSKRLSTEQVQRYLNGLLKNKSPSTVRLRLKQLRAIVRFAIRKGKYRFPDPTLAIDLPKCESIRQRYLTADEVKMVLDAVRTKPSLYLFVKMALNTGARLGTLISVQRKHIHNDGSIDLYNHKCQRWYKGYLDEETLTLLESRQGYVLSKPGFENVPPKKEAIQVSLLKILNKLFNTPDTPKEMRVVIHTLRHSVATQQLRKGVSIEVVSKTLDHSSIAVTGAVYAKVVPELVRAAVSNLWDD